MSSVGRSTQQSSEPTAKKKFGKNLNKLTKPPAPPISSGVKSTSSSRNGLLLLSTKRPSSSSNAVSSIAGSVGGILSNKPSQTTSKALPSLGLQYESNTSTHDALLGAVVGASRSESQQQPDAWGVAEKHQKAHNDELHLGQVEKLQEPTLAPKGGVSSVNHSYPENGIRYREMEPNHMRYDRHSGVGSHYDATPNNNWDDYGGRQHPGENRDVGYVNSDFQRPMEREENDDNVQGAFMSRLARERAEKRRAEEEARLLGQKERAAQRLRELEQKMASPGQADSPSENGVSMSGRAGEGTPGAHSPKSRVVLEKLNRINNSQGGTSPHNSVASGGERNGSGVVRTLYDPNRTYSSLVGGGNSKLDKGNDLRSGAAETGPQTRNSRGAGGAYLHSPDSANQSFGDSNRDSQYNRQVIHLSSYEDRDRGERGSSAGPRMLYDPKSGSMVAVPTREETTSGGRGRKDRNKKGRNGRDKDSQPSKSDSRQDSSTTDGPKSGRKGKGRKDENGVHNRGRSGGDSSPSKAELKKGRVANSERRLPRTCGVLYSRDDKGNCYCADGCDGDLGYGAHSVPGGRTRNAEAYAKFMDGQKQLYHQEEPPLLEEKFMDNQYDTEPHHQDASPGITLHTGFNMLEPKEPKLDWVKPNEKIVLVTGVDDSPTLQATAKEWAPSQAALAAAAAAIEQEKTAVSVSVASLDGQEEDEETDDDGPFGLGFDPTLNMDSMMQSPSAEPTSSLDAVDLAALSLEPAINPASSRHIFAFESGATWGASSTTGSNDWGVPAGGHAFSNDGGDRAVGAATFLSLSSTNTWGATAVSGLGGTPLGGTSMNGDHTRPAGD